jgi:PII-like signaling protein
MKLEGHGRRARIYIGESDTWHGGPLYVAIVQAARCHGLAGATVARGIMGFGGHSVIHKRRALSLSQDAPVVIELVDTDEKIRAFLPVLDEMITEGMITTSEVEIVSYRSGKG